MKNVDTARAVYIYKLNISSTDYRESWQNGGSELSTLECVRVGSVFSFSSLASLRIMGYVSYA